MEKKIIRLIASVLIIGTVFAGCGKDVQNESQTFSDEATRAIIDRDEMLIKIDNANKNENLVKHFDKIAYDKIWYYPEGGNKIQYVYYDTDQYVIVDGENVYIDKNGFVYGFDSEEETCYQYCFLGDAYQYIQEDETSLVNSISFDYEVIVDKNTKDGKVVVESRTEDEFEVDVYAAYFGMDEGSVKAIKVIKEVDEETYIVKKQEIYFVTADKEMLIYTESMAVEPDKYINEDIQKAIEKQDKMVIHFVVGSGTDKEKTYNFEVSKDVKAVIYADNSMEDVQYLDREYTKEYDGTPVDGEITLYVKYKK